MQNKHRGSLKSHNKTNMDEQELYNQAYDQAIKYLNIRLHTVGELSQKLKAKRFSERAILQVLRKLEELDFLNDERYAQIYVENLKRYKNFGYYGIKAKLMQRKIPSDIIARVLEEFLTEEEELEQAERFLAKLKRQQRDSYEKLARSLSSKGFRSEVIRDVLKGESVSAKD